MPTSAIAAYGTELRLGNGIPLAPLAITDASNTTPVVVTCAAHGIPVGDVSWADVAGVTGNTGANGSWVVWALTATTLQLRYSVGTGAYAGGGTLTMRNTFLTVAELVNITPIGIAFNMVDCSAHDGSGWEAPCRPSSAASICASRSTWCPIILRMMRRRALLAWRWGRFGGTGSWCCRMRGTRPWPFRRG